MQRPAKPACPRQLGDLQKTITMAQIAKAAGVSQGAISSLLNDRDYGIRVSEKTRERVFKVCREMGYIPNDLRAVVRMYPELGDCCLLISATLRGRARRSVRRARCASAAMAAVSDPSTRSPSPSTTKARDYSRQSGGSAAPGARRRLLEIPLLRRAEASLLLQALHRRGLPVVEPRARRRAARRARASCPITRRLRGSRSSICSSSVTGTSASSPGPFGATDPQILELNRGVRLACDELGLPIEARNIVYGDLSEQSGRSRAGRTLRPSARADRDLLPERRRRRRRARAPRRPAACASPAISVSSAAAMTCARSSPIPPLTTVHLPGGGNGGARGQGDRAPGARTGCERTAENPAARADSIERESTASAPRA